MNVRGLNERVARASANSDSCTRLILAMLNIMLTAAAYAPDIESALQPHSSCGPASSYEKSSSKYTSQGGEDAFLDAKVFRQASDGVYLDIGCNDGIDGSNTWYFVQQGWRGSCIEADPMKFGQIARNSQRHDGVNVAVAAVDGTLDFERVSDPNGGLSGLPSAHFDKARASGFQKTMIKVNASTPVSLLSRHYPTARAIDYVSLDVEGSELDVLQSWPFDGRWCVDAWTIENNFWCNDGTILPALTEMLGKQGYEYTGRIWVDEVFVRKQPCEHGVRWKADPRRGVPPGMVRRFLRVFE